jgi:hypothetical protein
MRPVGKPERIIRAIVRNSGIHAGHEPVNVGKRRAVT